MATYFESKKENGSFVINDQYLAVQLLGAFKGEQATYKYQDNEDTYILNTGSLNAKEVIWGFSLNSIIGLGIQSVMFEPISETQLKIRLFKRTQETKEHNNTWTKRDDASIQKFIFYAFTYKRVFNKSANLTGIEIYDANGNVVYSSAIKAIHIKRVFSGKGWFRGGASGIEGSVSISWNGEGVLIPIGYLLYIDRDVMCYGDVVGVSVNSSGNGTLYLTDFSCTSAHRRPTQYSKLLFNTLGCLICELR